MNWDPVDAWDGLRVGLESIPGLLPDTPKAILCVSAHWEDAPVAVEVGETPELVYDYYGFPEHTYQLTYPAPGQPEVAQRVCELLTDARIAVQPVSRGWDHGVFVPLKVAFPDADIPVVAMSLQGGLDPNTHLAIGSALAPLRDEGVVIIGSGSSFHNLQVWGSSGAAASESFDQWLHAVLPQPGPQRAEALMHWRQAPAAASAHPREEHLIPLHVAAGAAADEQGRAFLAEPVAGMDMSCWIFGG